MSLHPPYSNTVKNTIVSFLKNKLPWIVRENKKPAEPSIKTRPARLGLALSCGGAKSLAHVGVLQVLEENNIPIHAIAGSSMGAYIGSLWATGHNAEQMLKLAAEMQDPTTMRKLADPVIPPIRGVFYGNKVKAQLARSIGASTFEELNRKLLVISANLDTYERIVFRSGSILDAVHASCAMPGIIVPVEINGMRCTDGGVVDPVPVGALSKFTEVDHVIAVSTIPTLEEIDTHLSASTTAEDDRQEEVQSWWQKAITQLGNKINPGAPGNIIDNLRRSLRASQIRMAHDSCLRADITIRPISRGSEWHQYHQFEQFIELGRQKTHEVLPDIQKLLTPKPINDDETTEKPLVGKRVA
ncbi:patatin-like phospholipase family protein [Rubritalea spongiae]|uniref:Patatin-like phospholipase family protein n=1 Tax=Rubritalea spongiae TaxID=430797 RepID=A0ABW5E842_9BACT